jgi:excisionase family DNA binding protein
MKQDTEHMKQDTKQEQDDASNRLLRKKELAKRLGVSCRTVDCWQRLGRIAYLKIGKSCRYRWADVLEKLNARFRVN